MIVKAEANNLRMSPRKTRLVAKEASKLTPTNAVVYLQYLPKKAAMPLKKVIASAIANARHNYGLSESGLRFKSIEVMQGSPLKRYRAGGRGRVRPINKPTSHIRVLLEGEEKLPEPKAVQTLENVGGAASKIASTATKPAKGVGGLLKRVRRTKVKGEK
ncbi:MAG TPA: 50S ribosomal protein L22 [Patescibacteria group bacterium]